MLRLDKLYNLDRVRIKDACLRIVYALDKERAEAVVAASAVFFLEVCDRYGVDVRRVLETTDRVRKDIREKNSVEYRALKRYLKEELPDD